MSREAKHPAAGILSIPNLDIRSYKRPYSQILETANHLQVTRPDVVAKREALLATRKTIHQHPNGHRCLECQFDEAMSQ